MRGACRPAIRIPHCLQYRAADLLWTAHVPEDVAVDENGSGRLSVGRRQRGVFRRFGLWHGRRMTEKTVTAIITGRVQGVAFRAWTRGEAEARGLRGWVRNEPDGSVRAEIAGPRGAVDDMLAALRHGPPAAEVRDVTTSPAEPPDGDGFEIRG